MISVIINGALAPSADPKTGAALAEQTAWRYRLRGVGIRTNNSSPSPALGA